MYVTGSIQSNVIGSIHPHTIGSISIGHQNQKDAVTIQLDGEAIDDFCGGQTGRGL